MRFLLALLLLGACGAPVREPEAIVVPPGEGAAGGLSLPESIAFDYQGRAYVVESGGRLLRLEDKAVVAEDPKTSPWTDVVFRDGWFYVAAAGAVLRVSSAGAVSTLLDTLPGRGSLAFGPDGWLYLGLGAGTNAGVTENEDSPPDVPCRTVTLSGQNFEAGGKLTGAFVPWGMRTSPGQQVDGRLPCSGSVLKIHPETGRPELVAWGFRNPAGLAFSPAGRLYVADQGYADSGSRPVWGAGDVLWAAEDGAWHGWPDLHAGRPLPAKPLLQEAPGKPPRPAAVLGVGAEAGRMDFERGGRRAFVALAGERRVVAVDVETGVVTEAASGFVSPSAARLDPRGKHLWVVDRGAGAVRRLSPSAPVRLVKTRRGEIAFFENCHSCHPNGKAGLGPALVDGRKPEFWLRRGTRRHPDRMPSFDEARLSERQLDDLLAYLEELRAQEER